MRKLMYKFKLNIVQIIALYTAVKYVEKSIRVCVETRDNASAISQEVTHIDVHDELLVIHLFHGTDDALTLTQKFGDSDQTMREYVKRNAKKEKTETEELGFKHVQNYHYLMDKVPGIKIKSVFISGNADNKEVTPDNTFIKSSDMILAIKELGRYLHDGPYLFWTVARDHFYHNPSNATWTLLFPQKDTVYLKDSTILKHLKELDDDIQFACPLGKYVYDVDFDQIKLDEAKSEEIAQEIKAELKSNGITKNEHGVNHDLKLKQKEADLLVNKHRFGRWLEQIKKGGSGTRNWLIDENVYLKHEQAGCAGDVFFIRTQLLNEILSFGPVENHWFSVIDQTFRRILPVRPAQGMEIETIDIAELPILSNWIFNFARFKQRDFDPLFKHRPNMKMIDMVERDTEERLAKSDCQIGDFCHYEHKNLIQRYFAFGDPQDNVDMKYKRTELPDIYLRPGETKLDFAHTPKSPCRSSSARYVALIKTSFAAANTKNASKARDRVRQMFDRLLRPDQYQLYFLIGNGTVQVKKGNLDFPWLKKKEPVVYVTRSFHDDDLQAEIAKHDDLVIGDFLDTYENLPVKTFLGYKFLAEQCNGQYDYVTFTDDDALLDLKKLVELLALTDKTEPSIHCLKGSPIAMNKAPHKGKYYLWESLYPDMYTPPAYCNGQCAMLTASAANAIYDAARRTDRHDFRLEDFYFVGILRTKANLPEPRSVLYRNKDGGMNSLCLHTGDCSHTQDECYVMFSNRLFNDSLQIKPTA